MTDPLDAPTGAVDAATRGVDAVLGREVAMVTLAPVRGQDLVVRTEQVRRLAGLHHAHLLEVFDVDGLAEDTESTLVLQSVDGRGLDATRDRARWSSLAVAEIGAQAASALAHAHAHGVVHGAIGPASVVVGGTGDAPFAWLTGFTAALHPDPAVAPGQDPGTTGAVEPAGDVAALGRVLALALDPGAFAATTLEQALAVMVGGSAGAATAAESLARIAESLHRVDSDETGLVPVVASSPAPRVVHPVLVSAGAGSAGGVALAEAPLSRRARLTGRGLQIAALGGATLALAAASGLVLWASEGPSGVTPRPTGLASVPVPTPPPAEVVAPTAGSRSGEDAVEERTTRRTTRAPITSDVTTTRPPPAVVVPPVAPTVVVPPTTPRATTPPPAPDPDPTTTTRRAPTRPRNGNATLAAP